MFGSLAIRNYRLFAGGQAVSLTGTWMQRVAQDWLVLELSHDSGTALGIVTGLQFLPLLVFGLYGGVLADRYDKRLLLTAAQVAMGLLALALGLLDVTGTASLGAVYLLALLLGLATVVDVPVRQSFVSELVGPEHVSNAIGLNSATFNGARVIGPAIAGVLVSTVGTGPVFLINAASYAAVVAGLLAMRDDELRRSEPVSRAKGQLVEGLRYVRGRPDLLLPILLVFVIGTFGLNFQITLALIAKEVFGRGASSYGLLSSMIAVGSLAGALLATRRSGRPRLRVLIGSALAFGVLEVATGLMPTYESLAVLLVPTGAAVLLFTTAANASVQLGSDPSLRGRVMSVYVMVFLGGTPIGGPLIGALADAFGARSSLVVGGLVSTAATLAVAVVLGRGRHLRVVAHQRPRPHVHLRADGTDGWRLPARASAERRAG